MAGGSTADRQWLTERELMAGGNVEWVVTELCLFGYRWGTLTLWLHMGYLNPLFGYRWGTLTLSEYRWGNLTLSLGTDGAEL